MTVPEIIERLRRSGSAENVAGMARYGIVTKEAFGVAAPVLKDFARELKKTAVDRHALTGTVEYRHSRGTGPCVSDR